MNLPNQLTVARLFLAMLFVGLMTLGNISGYILAYAVFVSGTITDYYDGKIARARGLVTSFGKLLDPVADKVLIVGAFVMLMEMPGLRVPGWTVVVIIMREFLVTGVRSIAASEGKVIAANKWGKTKTVLQMVYVFVFLALAVIALIVEAFPELALLAPGGIAVWRQVLGICSLWAMVFVAAYTVYSGYQFMRINWRDLNLGKGI